ncbi:MAG: hypothetical protein NXI24_24200 [bacterium]|nr:hypothetical protein [bacterium]
MLHETPFIGDVYTVPERNHAVVEKVLRGEAASIGIYSDAHGRWISGMAPIANSRGEISGILEVDYPIDAVLSQKEIGKPAFEYFTGGSGRTTERSIFALQASGRTPRS